LLLYLGSSEAGGSGFGFGVEESGIFVVDDLVKTLSFYVIDAAFNVCNNTPIGIEIGFFRRTRFGCNGWCGVFGFGCNRRCGVFGFRYNG